MRLWTVPNALSLCRLVGVGPLLWAAAGDHRSAFSWIMVALLATDWLDGKLAIALDQRTAVGARLDSLADWVMYASLGLSFWWLEGAAISSHAAWIAAVLATWAASAGVSLVRFGRPPSYHSQGAKLSWLVVAAAAVVLLFTGRSWPLPWALALVALTNLEAVAMGLTLPAWKADVPNLRQAMAIRRRAASGDGSTHSTSGS